MKNQKLLWLLVISFIPMTFMCDLQVILLGEIRCWSLLGVKGSNQNYLRLKCISLRSRCNFGERGLGIFLTKVMAYIFEFNGSGRLGRERN